tara:strand:- start:405 stop:524 length:120 start_codon:yes stop_codon:yes gene_type:complete
MNVFKSEDKYLTQDPITAANKVLKVTNKTTINFNLFTTN